MAEVISNSLVSHLFSMNHVNPKVMLYIEYDFSSNFFKKNIYTQIKRIMYFIKEDNLDCVLYNHDESLNIKLSEISIDGVESVS